VRVLYRQILLREPEQSEVDFQVVHMNGANARRDLAVTFLSSPEFRITTGPRLTAALLYITLLGRNPDKTEMGERVAQISANVPLEAIIGDILSGSEFEGLLR
jgi:hypothetical protein